MKSSADFFFNPYDLSGDYLTKGLVGNFEKKLSPQWDYNAMDLFNDRFYLSFFVAMLGFRDSGFDFYWILY